MSKTPLKPIYIIHVTPVNDLKPHLEAGFECECGPKVQKFTSFNSFKGKDETGTLVTHNSFDGREYFEKDYKGKIKT